jgi:hypothetical protein
MRTDASPLHRNPAKLAARAILFLAGSAFGFAQVIDAITPTGLEQAGFHLSQISVFSSYSSLNETLTAPGYPSQENSGYGLGAGILAGVGWSKKVTDSSSFSVNYNISDNYQYHGSGSFNAGYLTQAISAAWSHQLGTKFSISASLSGAMGSFNQLILSPTSQQVLTGLPGSAQDLAGAVALGQTSNPDLTAAESGASALIGPEEGLFYGGRFFTATAATSIAYSATPRLRLSLGIVGSRIQHLADQNAGQNVFIIPQTTSAGASANIAYELNPRTSISGSVAYFRGISPISIPSGTATVALGRELTQQFFVRASAGAGFYFGPEYNTAGIQTGSGTHLLQATYSAAAGYRARSQTFLVSVNRSVANNYGVVASGMLSAIAAWSWRRPGSDWSLSAGAGESRFSGSGWGGNNGYRANVSLRRKLSPRFSASLQLGYASFSGSGILPETSALLLVPETFHSATKSVRLGLTFSGMANAESRSGKDKTDPDPNGNPNP